MNVIAKWKSEYEKRRLERLPRYTPDDNGAVSTVAAQPFSNRPRGPCDQLDVHPADPGLDWAAQARGAEAQLVSGHGRGSVRPSCSVT